MSFSMDDENIRFYDSFAHYYSIVYGCIDATATVRQWLQLLESENIIPSLEDRCRSNLVLLDAGCGPGWFLPAWAQAGFKVVGIDSSPAMLRLAANTWRREIDAALPPLILGNLCESDSISSFHETIDVVVCHSNLPHLIHPDALPLFCGNISGVLKPGGILAFDHMFPADDALDGDETHTLPFGGKLERVSRSNAAGRYCVQHWHGNRFSGKEFYWLHDSAELDSIFDRYGVRLYQRWEWNPNHSEQPFRPVTRTSERLISLYQRRTYEYETTSMDYLPP